jgi:multisubunit Na+/H+ antiporter MnhE subunit
MEIVKIILLFFLGFIFGFGFWYMIFWFVSNEPNLFMWHWVTKIVYLILSFSSTSGIINGLLKDFI